MVRPRPASAVTCPASSAIPASRSSMLAATDSGRSTAAWAPSTALWACCSSGPVCSRRSATSLVLSDSSRPSRNRTKTPTLTNSAQKTAAISAAAPAAFTPCPLAGPSASWLLLVVPFAENGLDPTGAFGNAGLLAMPRRLVVDAVRHRIGSVALRDDAVIEVVRVTVALTVADLARPRIVRVAQVRRHRAYEPVSHVGAGRVDGLDHGVGLGRQRDVDDRLGQVDPGLGQPDELDRLGRGHRGQQRGRVGHAHVLAGVHDKPPGDEPRVLPRLDHPGQVVQGRVHVTAPQGLDERTDHVVMLVAVPVVADRGPVHGALQRREVDVLALFAFLAFAQAEGSG